MSAERSPARKAAAGAPATAELGLLGDDLGYLLRRAQLAVFADFGETLAELELRPGQFAVLTAIDHNPGVTQSDVCQLLGIQRPNFVAVIDDLEARGLARRTSSVADRRSNSLQLTAAGKRLLQRAVDLQREHESRLARRLGPGGRQTLLELLSRIANTE
jgi:DNA-binding MarR family transcriptional regulator